MEHLQPAEAQQVLRTLLAARPDIMPVAEKIAGSLLADVSCEQVADNVEEALLSLDFDDVHAGPTEFGYTEPDEGAWEALEEAVRPFHEDLKRHIELALEAEALEICKGILLGLYRVRERRSHDVLAYAEDFPEEAAGNALDTWQRTGLTKGAKKRRRPDFPRTS